MRHINELLEENVLNKCMKHLEHIQILLHYKEKQFLELKTL